MDILKLYYFRAVSQTEHISKAAEKMHITQPALSKAVALLEDEIGAPLFDRVGRRIYLNTYGKAFLPYAEAMLSAYEEGTRAVNEIACTSNTIIRLQTNISSDRYLVKLLHNFRKQNPDITFDIIKNYSKSKFLNNCDFYIHATGIKLNKCISVPLFTEEILLGVPVSHRLACKERIDLKEVKEESFITLNRSSSWTEEIMDYCFQAGFKPQFSYLCDANELLAKLIAEGEGIGFLPAESWGEYPPGVKLLHIDRPVCQRSYYLSWQAEKPETPVIVQFRDYILQCFQKSD